MGVVFGLMYACFILWIICGLVIDDCHPEWSQSKQAYVALAIAIFIICNLVYIGYSK